MNVPTLEARQGDDHLCCHLYPRRPILRPRSQSGKHSIARGRDIAYVHGPIFRALLRAFPPDKMHFSYDSDESHLEVAVLDVMPN